MKTRQQRFTDFCKELESLSVKHGVSIHTSGGVNIHDRPLISATYDDDASSGDLAVRVSERY